MTSYYSKGVTKVKYEVAHIDDHNRTQPWFILETFLTTDGHRTRVCDGFYTTKAETHHMAELKANG